MGTNADDALERALIETFLSDRGHTLHTIDALPREERESLLRRATQFASLRLTEMESRAHLLDELRRKE